MVRTCKSRIAASLLLAFSLLLIGCQAMQYMHRGDEALLQGRPHEALASYQRAAQHDPKLRADPEYLAKLNEATWQSAFADAQSQSMIQNWERAIGSYETALAHNPGFQPAVGGLAKAKVEGAQGRYERAIENADAGDLKTAEANLTQALTWNPGHASAKAALDSIARRDLPTASEQRYAASLRQVEAKHWDQVASETTAIILGDQNHLPARALLHRAKEQLAESRKLHEQASTQFGNQRFDDAIETANQSLQIWSTNPDASDLLSRAQAKREESERHYVRAQNLAEQGDFDDALTAMGDCLDVYPYHPAGATFMKQTRLDAAATFNAQGQQQLEAGKLHEAEQAFRRVLRYVPGDTQAKDGLVEVIYAYGQGAEKQGLVGNALLFYMDTVKQRPKSQKYAQAEKRVRDAIGEKVAFSVSLEVNDPQGRETKDTSSLESRATALASNEKPDYVTLVSADVDGNVKPRGPLYRAMVKMEAIQIQQDRVSKDRKEHLYTGYRPVPNPNIPQLEGELQNAERDLAFARGNLIRHSCDACGGRGHITCRHCGGSRFEQCHHCGGNGRVRVGPGFQVCSFCGGRGREQCHHCTGGHFRCDRCGGRGFVLEVDSYAVSRADSAVRDLRYRLSREPVTVQEQYQVSWPYEQETHQKTGGFAASVRIDRAGDNSVVQSFEVEPRFSQTDKVILNPAPQYGLQPDDLRLPPDDTVYRVLVDDGADQLSRGMLQAAAVARANEFIAKANDEAKQGNTDLDIEARVAAMVLLEPVRPSEAKRILDEIRNPKASP